MIAEELMIGNWVEYHNQYWKVVDILTFHSSQKFTLRREPKGQEPVTIYGIKEVNPIPINESILCQISEHTYHDTDTDVYFFKKDGFSPYICHKDGQFLFGKMVLGLDELIIEYVHHLQNTIKLFKINKKIEL